MTRARLLAAVLALLPLIASAKDAPRQQAQQKLLSRLHSQLALVHSSKRKAPPGTDKIDLAPLIGVKRRDLVSALGAPDFCESPDADGCGHAKHWNYFFFHYHPPGARSTPSGSVIMLPPTEGLVLEVGFSKHSKVKAIAWAK
jgi:hypothetical protein